MSNETMTTAASESAFSTLAQTADARTIEAAKAICRVNFGSIVEHGDGRCCQVGGIDGCCLETLIPAARAALSAADAMGAPEMLAALHSARAWIISDMEEVGYSTEDTAEHPAIFAINLAIAKAEGR